MFKETWNLKLCSKSCPKIAKSPLPVDERRSKMLLLKLFDIIPFVGDPYETCRSAAGLSQVCHRSVQSYSRPIWRKTEVCKSAYCLWQTSHENDCFFDCVLPFILFAASLLQTFRDFWWLCNKDLLLCLHLICSRRCGDNHPHETCSAVQRHKIASK